MKQLRTLKPFCGMAWLGLAWMDISKNTTTTRAPSGAKKWDECTYRQASPNGLLDVYILMPKGSNLTIFAFAT